MKIQLIKQTNQYDEIEWIAVCDDESNIKSMPCQNSKEALGCLLESLAYNCKHGITISRKNISVETL